MSEVREWLKAALILFFIVWAAPYLAGMFAHVIVNATLDGWRSW